MTLAKSALVGSTVRQGSFTSQSQSKPFIAIEVMEEQVNKPCQVETMEEPYDDGDAPPASPPSSKGQSASTMLGLWTATLPSTPTGMEGARPALQREEEHDLFPSCTDQHDVTVVLGKKADSDLRCTAAAPFWEYQPHKELTEEYEACSIPLALMHCGDLPMCFDLDDDYRKRPRQSMPSSSFITMVPIDSVEQRRYWCEFLAEQSARSCAKTLWQSNDVEPDPPMYSRPRPSAPPHLAGLSACTIAQPRLSSESEP